jgi:hypothetical protein
MTTPKTVLDEGLLASGPWWIFFAAGLLLSLRTPTRRLKAGLPSVILGAIGLTAAYWAPPALAIGLVCTSLAALGSGLDGPLARLVAACRTVGAMWLAQLVASLLYQHAAARVSALSLLAPALAFVARLFGVQATSSSGFLFVHDDGFVQRILTSPEKLGGLWYLLFMCGFCIALRVIHVKGKTSWFCLAMSLSYVLLRFLWLVAFSWGRSPQVMWWDEGFVGLSFVPMALFLFALVARHRAGECEPLSAEGISNESSRGAGAWVWAASAVFVVWGFVYEDPGAPKHGSIVIDEHYSDWEPTRLPLDTEIYGVRTVYSYRNMAEDLARRYRVRIATDEITDASLADASVLILKTPTSAYSDEAVGAIHRFVEHGGGVWLISDHTDVFGMSTYLNQIAATYGSTFRFDAAIDPETNRQLLAPTESAHPIVRSLPTYLMYTSCSIQAPWMAKDALLSDRLLLDEADHSTNTFFGNFQPDWYEPITPVVQAVAVRSGKGRVVLWSDSTPFSNFAVFLPGKMALVNGTIDWLNRRNGPADYGGILIGGGFLLMAVGLWRFRSGLQLGLYVGCAIGYMAGIASLNSAYPKVPDRPCGADVAFLQQRPPFQVPVMSPDPDDPSPEWYLTAFIAAQRSGARPYVARSLQDALSAKCIVIVGHNVSLEPAEAVALDEWVRRGGRLMLVDFDLRPPTLLKNLAAKAGITPSSESFWTNTPAGRAYDTTRRLRVAGGAYIGRSYVDGPLAGGTPLVYGDTNGRVYAACNSYGQGSVWVSSTAVLFSDWSLGANSTIPNGRQLALLRLLFAAYPFRPAARPSTGLPSDAPLGKSAGAVTHDRTMGAGPQADQASSTRRVCRP